MYTPYHFPDYVVVMHLSVSYEKKKQFCFKAGLDKALFSVYFCLNMSWQVDGPSYKLLYKKDKAHEMDINGVQWSSKVNMSINISLCNITFFMCWPIRMR